jgi:site-specific recombinase XerD
MWYGGYSNHLEDFTKLLEIKRYSVKTIKSYRNALNVFIKEFPNKDIAHLSVKDIEDFINRKVTQQQISVSYQKSLVGAIKFFYKQVLRRNYSMDYLYPERREYKLPVILSKEEVHTILSCITNLKHKALISTLYACGLRLGELLNLTLKDIDSQRMLVRIEQGKGKKDRYVPLPGNLLELLRAYYKKYKPYYYLFEGQSGGKYAARSVQNVFKRAVARAGVKKHVSVHTLRHSYATHLLESGVDVRVIQKLLGHASIKTTQIYTQVTHSKIQKVRSPFEDMAL